MSARSTMADFMDFAGDYCHHAKYCNSSSILIFSIVPSMSARPFSFGSTISLPAPSKLRSHRSTSHRNYFPRLAVFSSSTECLQQWFDQFILELGATLLFRIRCPGVAQPTGSGSMDTDRHESPSESVAEFPHLFHHLCSYC